jgi:serine protease Do
MNPAMASPNNAIRCVGTLAIVSAIWAFALMPGAARGQQVDAQLSSSTTSEEDRDALYDQLSRDVDSLDRELGLVKRVVKLVTPSVVHIEAQPLPRFRGRLDIEEEGSGVIVRIGDRFYVLTNRHVIRHSTEPSIRIHLADGRQINPIKKWDDQETDVAVMSIEATGLVAARIGDSDALEIGDYVLAMGSPFGLSRSVTRGIVSAEGRYNLDLGDGELKWQNFIQTDAAINPGNSGGPLINYRGEVVGLNTAIASSSGGNEGIGFSIPINIVIHVARQLVETGEVARGYLGVKLDVRFNEELARAIGLPSLMGTRITGVEAASPAGRAGLKVDDIILGYNGVRVERDLHLISLVKLTEVGRHIPLEVLRDGRMLRVDIEIGDLREISKTAQ